MNLLDPKAPLLFGAVMIGILAAYLTAFHPAPGPLAAPHAKAVAGIGLATCRACHAQDGLTAGCLGCHSEIKMQIAADEGYHAFLLRGQEGACARCHPDHLGSGFPLVGSLSWNQQDPNAYSHSHIRFTLDGAHRKLACDSCHRRAEPFTLPDFPSQPRRTTYLGLTQECADCHEDVHAGALARSCELCHGQDAFRPAHQFRHDDYYVLEGVHLRAACTDCHSPADSNGRSARPIADVNEMRAAFDKVKGTTCEDCHRTPHRTQWPGDCLRCHLGADETWAKGARGVQPETHALTGFPLDEAHAFVACEKCHGAGETYDRRYPDPGAVGYRRRSEMCAGCHEDAHGGQFRGRYSSCADCHGGEHFKPALFGVAHHEKSYPLKGPHATVACEKCHPIDPDTQIRRFVAVPRQCESCHADPHGGQFRARHAQCTDCHEQERFLPARYDVARHGTVFPLTGAHAAVPCIQCHVVTTDAPVRRFASTTRACRDCHADPHAGQFEREMAGGDCTACHRQDAGTFGIRPYDHARQAGYPLTGAHAKAPCEACHRRQRTGEGSGPFQWTRVYRNTPVACDACHTDVHRSQFKEDGAQDCGRCHGSTESWTADRFAHDRDARFKLEGAHGNSACSACHPAVRQPDGQDVIQYRPLGARCEDCHGLTPN